MLKLFALGCVVFLGGYSLAILYEISFVFVYANFFGGVRPWHFIENMCVWKKYVDAFSSHT